MTAVRAVAAALAVGLLAACAGSDDDGAASAEAGVVVREPWARATAAGTTVGSIYLVLESPDDDTLEAVTVDAAVAGSTMIHETTTGDGGMTSMDHAAGGVDLPAGEPVTLEPNGTHVMLEDLAAPLVAGDTFTATLSFADAPDQTITVDVRDDAP